MDTLIKDTGYQIFDWMGDDLIQNMTLSQAKKKYKVFMVEKDSRVAELKKLVEPELIRSYEIVHVVNPKSFDGIKKINEAIPMSLDYSVYSLIALNEWVYARATAFGESIDIPLEWMANDVGRQAIMLIPTLWKSIAVDCAIYFYDVLKKEDERMAWGGGSHLRRR